LASTTVAAPAPISTQGCSVGARIMANHGGMLSTCCCHFGGFFGGLGRPLARMCRTAITTRTSPSTIFTASDASDGAVAGLGGLSPGQRERREGQARLQRVVLQHHLQVDRQHDHRAAQGDLLEHLPGNPGLEDPTMITWSVWVSIQVRNRASSAWLWPGLTTA
jgi:hypothetical protein